MPLAMLIIVSLLTIHNCINNVVPSKYAYTGGGEPEFVTPLIKSILNQQYILRRQDKLSEANVLAVTPNNSCLFIYGLFTANLLLIFSILLIYEYSQYFL